MSVCQSYGCDNKTAIGTKYCDRCWEEIVAMRSSKSKPLPWKVIAALFLVIATYAAYTALHLTGRL